MFRLWLFLACLAPAAAFAQEPDFTGHWEGALEIPGRPLTFMIDLRLEEAGLSGTIDIPMQGAKGLPLADIDVAGDRIRFAIANIPGDPKFDGVLKDSAVAGTFTQAGQNIPFKMGRDKLAAPHRPQEPKPPFPYRVEEASYQNGDVTLTGTLTLPEGDGPFPAALLVSGSGAQDRDSALMGHKPFLVWADYLTRAGIAVLRVDDRGVGGSGGSVADATSAVFAEDALAGLAYLRERPEIAADKTGIIGHSEGGIVGPLAAAQSDEVAFVVMLAGPGAPSRDIVLDQIRYGLKARQAPPAEIEKQLGFYRKAIENVAKIKDVERLKEENAKLMSALHYAMSDSERQFAGDRETFVKQHLSELDSRWFRYFIAYDPKPALTRIRCPVLALFGELDFQVTPEMNQAVVEQALAQAPSEDVTVKTLPGLNHLLQKAVTGDGSEYGAIEETVNPAALSAVRDWILKRFGP